MPDGQRRASGTTRRPPRHFIPGTNAIESINYQLRKVSKTCGQFPTDDAVYKILYLAVCDIESRDKSRGGTGGRPKNLLNRGSTTHGWTAALNQFEIIFPGRLPAQI
jgi:putative transposase